MRVESHRYFYRGANRLNPRGNLPGQQRACGIRKVDV
jgi:hypothetical protein